MTILNQDRDEIFTLSDKTPLGNRVYIKVQYFQGQLMGWNVMGSNLKEEVLLGTYDEQDARQLVQEIYRLMRAGVKHYVMPEAAMDLEDLE